MYKPVLNVLTTCNQLRLCWYLFTNRHGTGL